MLLKHASAKKITAGYREGLAQKTVSVNARTLFSSARYRVKAVALPASTLRMLPVDLAERSEAK